MEIHQIIFILVQIINVISKKYVSSSDESIENLLYFKDCQKDKDVSTTHPPIERLQAPPQPRAMDCPFPKMCCSITCNGGNDCNSPSPSFFGQQNSVAAEQVFPPIRPLSAPLQPPMQPASRGRKKKMKQPMRMQLPMMGGRRDFGFTKDRIKSLINQDDDIRKILKDLVRVTMQKVDLVDKINTRRQVPTLPRPTPKNSAHEDDDDDELE